MINISHEEVLKFFARNNNRFRNSEGMELGWSDEAGIWTYLTASNYGTSPLKVSISTEEDDIAAFINGFKLQKIEDIDRLSYTNSWMRYLNGYAEMIITPMELEADLSFKIYRWKTIIFSMDLHFYDEVNEHLTMPEDFVEYLTKNERKLQEVNNNRYRVRRA
jgi:hypothetical protein